MKTKLYSMLIFIFALAIEKNFGQIPNNGFDTWTSISLTTGVFDVPNDWKTSNFSCSGYPYSVYMSMDTYPISIGNYSIKIRNNISLLPNSCAFGVIETGEDSLNNKFAITGHPSSLTGWYKFLPQGGDTMTISTILYNNGSQVSIGNFQTNVSATSWTSFNISFPTYTIADSASISIAAYCLCGSPTQYYPHGNTVLLIDNMNFDNLITGISDFDEAKKTYIFPNPFSEQAVFHTDNILQNATLTVYNSLGQQVNQIKNISRQAVTLFRGNLPSGLYFIRMTQDSKVISIDKLVITDFR